MCAFSSFLPLFLSGQGWQFSDNVNTAARVNFLRTLCRDRKWSRDLVGIWRGPRAMLRDERIQPNRQANLLRKYAALPSDGKSNKIGDRSLLTLFLARAQNRQEPPRNRMHC